MPNIRPADYSASQVADYFVYLASGEKLDNGTPEGVTPLKLQKLLYFAEAASLSLFDKKLFKENVEAWKYGPVVSTIYHQYKDHLNTSLVNPSGEYTKITDPKAISIIKGVWELFGRYSAGELVGITHNHAPWKDTYREDENRIITSEVLRDYYKSIFEFKDNPVVSNA